MHVFVLPRRDLEADDQDLPPLNQTEKIALLDTKMVQLRDGHVDMDSLSPDEMRCFWQTLKTRMAKPDEQAQKASEM